MSNIDDEPIGYIEDEIVKYWKNLKNAGIENDIISETEHLLETLTLPLEQDELFVTQKEKLTLESWLGVQLQIERKGWKKKLNLSLKEVERERKLANIALLAVSQTYDAISSLNTIDTSGINGFDKDVIDNLPINYPAVDKDNRTHAIEALSNMAKMVTSLLKYLIDERQCSMELLKKFEKSNTNRFCNDENGVPSDDFKISFFDLLLGSLTQMSEENNTFRQELKELKMRSRYELRRTQDELKRVSEMLKSERRERTDERMMLTTLIAKQTINDSMPLNITLAASRLNVNDKYSQTTIVTKRNHAIQVDIPPEVKIQPEQNQVRDMSRYPTAKIKPKRRHQKKQDIGSDENSHQNSSEKSIRENWQLELYRREIAWIKSNPTANPNLNSNVNTSKCAYRSSLPITQQTDNEIATSQFSKSKVLPPLNKEEQRNKDKGIGTENRCVNCNGAYSLNKNCRYHPKGKIKLETSGAGLIQIWECCLQTSEARGCSVRHHSLT